MQKKDCLKMIHKEGSSRQQAGTEEGITVMQTAFYCACTGLIELL